MYEANAERKAGMQKQRPKQRHRKLAKKQKQMPKHSMTSVKIHDREVMFS